MPVSRAMRRLLDVLEIQEEQCRGALEEARAEFERLQQMWQHNLKREHTGRSLISESAATGEVADRIAGIEETQTAKRVAAALAPCIAETEAAVSARRREYLDKRVERRQTETLIEKGEAHDKAETVRREQISLDAWFLGQRRVK